REELLEVRVDTGERRDVVVVEGQLWRPPGDLRQRVDQGPRTAGFEVGGRHGRDRFGADLLRVLGEAAGFCEAVVPHLDDGAQTPLCRLHVGRGYLPPLSGGERRSLPG